MGIQVCEFLVFFGGCESDNRGCFLRFECAFFSFGLAGRLLGGLVFSGLVSFTVCGVGD